MHPFERIKLVPLLLIVFFIGLTPFIFALLTSFFHDVYGNRSFAGAENYLYLLSDSGLRYSLSITAAWSIITTVIVLSVSFFLAVALASGKGLFPKSIYGALLIPWGIPVYIGVPLWRGIIHGNGGESFLSTLFGIDINLLTDPGGAFFATVFVSVWLGIPVTTFVLLGALRKIPASRIEAGKIDGAHRGILVRHIYLPAVKNTLTVMGVLLFISALKEFSLLFLMTSGGPPLVTGITDRSIIGATTTLGVFLYEIFGETSDFGISSAYAVFLMGFVILLLLFWLFAKGRIKNKNIPIILLAAAQPLLSGWIGIVFGILYLAVLFRKNLFFPVFTAQVICSIVFIALRGFLRGFQAGILIALLSIPLLYKDRITRLGKDRFREMHALRPLPYALPVFMLAASGVLLFFLLVISISEGNIITFAGLSGRISGLGNFAALFTETKLHRFFLNTILLSGIAAVATPLICFPAASFLVQKGKKYVAWFLLGIQIVSVGGGIHTLLPLYAQFIRIGLGDSYLPLVLIYCYHAVPFSLFTMTAYLERHPKSLRDQAQIDGAGPLRYLVQVLVPTSLPIITTAGMITFMNGWNSFLAPLLFINNDAKYTISVKLFSLIGNIGSAHPQWNLFAAASVINLIIIAALFGPLKRPLQTTALRDFDD